LAQAAQRLEALVAMSMPRLLAVLGLPWCTFAAFGGLRPTTEVQEKEEEVPKPIMASRFHVTFKEYTHGLKPWGDGTYNVGSLHYDVGSDVARTVWSHGQGQTDNWCQCAGVNTAEKCDLLALPETKTTVALFKTLSPPQCCTIGTWSQGFGPLRPDWLLRGNATLVSTFKVGNRTCYEWASHHPGDWFTMVSDNWSLDAKGVPCVYEDRFNAVFRRLGLAHKLTFDIVSYDTAPETDDIFAIPKGIDCSRSCPNKKGWCKGG